MKLKPLYHISSIRVFPVFIIDFRISCILVFSMFPEYIGCILQLMQALRDLPSLEKMEYEQNEYGVTYGKSHHSFI